MTGLRERNPCDVRGAMNPKLRKKVVLLAGWCGMRFGEVSELRRRDFDSDCTTVTVARGVTLWQFISKTVASLSEIKASPQVTRP